MELISGTGKEQIVWQIKTVKRTQKYLDKDVNYKQGDSIMIEGDGEADKSTGKEFVSVGKQPFILKSSDNQLFPMQSIVADDYSNGNTSRLSPYTAVNSKAVR